MPTKPVSIGFNVSFNEAIAQAVKRGVVLPDIYYGHLQGLARQQAFSIAGITSLDTLQAVKDSLDKVITEGGTFGAWKKQMLESGTLNLPKHRLDNIYRTNLQGSYMAARWDRILLTQETRPYIMYDAINDSRVRPAHLALDGIIRRVDDPFWITHSPPNGYRCRCSIRSLSEHQAKARSAPGKGLNNPALLEDGTPALPDKGWDYNPSDRLAGVNKALADKRTKSSPVLMSALVDKLKKIPEFDIISGMDTLQKDYEKWAKQILQPDYKARHEFRQVGVLPDFVMRDKDVKTLKPVNNEVYISDHQIRHSVRDAKAARNAVLPVEVISNLPGYLRDARWFYDSKHYNLIAAFDVGMMDLTGKSIIAINFSKKKYTFNSVVTSGLVQAINLGAENYRELKKST